MREWRGMCMGLMSPPGEGAFGLPCERRGEDVIAAVHGWNTLCTIFL